MSFFKKIFLVKEIVSKTGILVFRRWRLISTSKFSIFFHQIYESDADRHCHNHRWNFLSLILKGGYLEEEPSRAFKLHRAGTINIRSHDQFHKLILTSKPTWTLVITGPTITPSWGYWVNGQEIDHQTYRQLKNEGSLDS